MGNCIFCDIYEKKEEIIYDGRLFFARFDRFPVSPGHAEVIPKRHVASLFDLTGVEWRELGGDLAAAVEAIRGTNLVNLYQEWVKNPLNAKSAQYCQDMLNHSGICEMPGGYNIGVNDGEAAGRTVPHLHVHVIPRFWGDVEDHVGGIRHIIPGKGNYRK